MSRFNFPDSHGDLIGAHISTKGGLHTVFERGGEINASAIALFAKNSNQWKGKTMSDDDVALFNEKRNVRPLLTHASYLINLATTNPEFHRKSIDAMIDELDRAERLGIHAVVLHPGAHMGAGADAGIDQGSCLGCSFEELGCILSLVDDKTRAGICFDTCHVFASGYELRNRDDYERTIEDLERHAGIANVGAFHLNDSKKPLGSRVDRHEHIGDGEIGIEAFALLLNDERFRGIPKVIETPKTVEHESDRKNLTLLRSLINSDPRSR
jgi:deoxyribonuclease-4